MFARAYAAASLLASNPFFQSLQDAVTQGPSSGEMFWFWAGGGVLLLGILLAAWYATRRDDPRQKPEPDYLTLAVDLLGLSEDDRRDLHNLARAAQLAVPASLLLSPANLARAVSHSTDAELRQRIAQLCISLFNEPLPAAVSASQNSDR